MNSTDCSQEDYDQKMKTENRVRDQCTMEIATQLLELKEMEKEVIAFMQIYFQKYLKLTFNLDLCNLQLVESQLTSTFPCGGFISSPLTSMYVGGSSLYGYSLANAEDLDIMCLPKPKLVDTIGVVILVDHTNVEMHLVDATLENHVSLTVHALYGNNFQFIFDIYQVLLGSFSVVSICKAIYLLGLERQ